MSTHTKKRALAVLICLCVMLSLMTTGVLAAGEDYTVTYADSAYTVTDKNGTTIEASTAAAPTVWDAATFTLTVPGTSTVMVTGNSAVTSQLKIAYTGNASTATVTLGEAGAYFVTGTGSLKYTAKGGEAKIGWQSFHTILSGSAICTTADNGDVDGADKHWIVKSDAKLAVNDVEYTPATNNDVHITLSGSGNAMAIHSTVTGDLKNLELLDKNADTERTVVVKGELKDVAATNQDTANVMRLNVTVEEKLTGKIQIWGVNPTTVAFKLVDGNYTVAHLELCSGYGDNAAMTFAEAEVDGVKKNVLTVEAGYDWNQSDGNKPIGNANHYVKNLNVDSTNIRAGEQVVIRAGVDGGLVQVGGVYQ